MLLRTLLSAAIARLIQSPWRRSTRSLWLKVSAIPTPFRRRARRTTARLTERIEARVRSAGLPAEHEFGTKLDGLTRRNGYNGKFSIFVADPSFARHQYPMAFATVQAGAGSRILDLTATTGMGGEFLVGLEAAWRCPWGRIPRMAIVLSFDQWAAVCHAIVPSTVAFAARGVEFAVFYREQGELALAQWIADGAVRHDVEMVLARLGAAPPGHSTPGVLAAAAELVRRESSPADEGRQMAVLASLAFRSDSLLAEPLAWDALTRVGPAASPTRALVLRVLACSALAQGRDDEGSHLLELAIATAELCDCPRELAAALCHDGGHLAARGNDPAAELRFRRAIMVLDAHYPGAEHVAVAHHGLAAVLMRQGRYEVASQHAEQALARWNDPDGPLATETRALLAAIYAWHAQTN